MFGSSDEQESRDVETGYLPLDQWRVSRLAIISPSSDNGDITANSVPQNKYVVARVYRTDSSQFMDLRLEPIPQRFPLPLEAVSTALNALTSSSAEYANRYPTDPELDWSSPTPPTTPNAHPLAVTFALSQVVNYDAKEEILYPPLFPFDEGSLTLQNVAQIASIQASSRYRGDFAEGFADIFKNEYTRNQQYRFSNHGNTPTNETDRIGSLIHVPEDEERSEIDHEFQRLSELRLQLAAELRSSLYDADKAAMEVHAFNARQCLRFQDVDGPPQALIEFEDDFKVKQDATSLIRRLERPTYISSRDSRRRQ